MSIDSIELLLHPVRLRIVNTMYGARILTTAELCARMPDIPQATMYRQVAILADRGILEVESEERIRGPAERRYRLQEDRAKITAEDGSSMSLEEHRRGFTVAAGALMAEFNAYLDRKGADPFRDRVSYRQFVLWVSDQEIEMLQTQFRTAITALMEQRPATNRTPYLLSTIFFPTDHRGGNPPPVGSD